MKGVAMPLTSYVETVCGNCAKSRYTVFPRGLLLKTLINRLKKECQRCGGIDFHIMPHRISIAKNRIP